MKTRTYLIAMAAVILIPVVLFSAVGLNMLLEREREARFELLEETARATALAIDLEMANSAGALRVLANTDFVRNDDFASLYELMERANRTVDTWTVVFNYEGDVLVNTLVPFGTPFPDANYDWVAPLIDNRQSSVSSLRTGVVSKVPVVSVNVPASTSSGKQYLISQIYRADRFAKLLRIEEIAPDWTVTLFDSEGIIIARNAEGGDFVGKPVSSELYNASMHHAKGRVRHVTQGNEEVYSVFTDTRNSNWTLSIGVPVERVEAAVRRATLLATLALVLTFVLATLAIFFLARRLTCALEDTVEAAHMLGQGRIPDIKPSHVKEVDVLQAAIRDAGNALMEENTARIKLENEREALLASEQQARKQAEDQNKHKDNFLAMLGHELRNPLAPIAAAADVLSALYAHDERITQTSAIVTRQTEHMRELIEDLLDISRIAKGLLELDKRELDARQIVSTAVEQVRPMMAARRHSLRTDMPDQAVLLLGDKKRLVQVLANLLNNAAKYTPDGGLITLEMTLDEEHVAIKVADNGVGMPPELVQRAFDMFEQAERSSDRSEGGLGIGLALVKNLVHLHGGHVSVHSAGPGCGTTFTICLPRIIGTNTSKNARSVSPS
jgi:signal transduction histidine kinase